MFQVSSSLEYIIGAFALRSTSVYLFVRFYRAHNQRFLKVNPTVSRGTSQANKCQNDSPLRGRRKKMPLHRYQRSNFRPSAKCFRVSTMIRATLFLFWGIIRNGPDSENASVKDVNPFPRWSLKAGLRLGIDTFGILWIGMLKVSDSLVSSLAVRFYILISLIFTSEK